MTSRALTSALLSLSHLSSALAEPQISPVPKTTGEQCTSETCTDYATYIRQSLASNYSKIDPCVDFDAYSCDGWREKHVWRSDQAQISIGVVLGEEIQGTLKSILESPYPENSTFTGAEKEADRRNFVKLTSVYKACMDETGNIKGYGVEPMNKLLGEMEKLYPVKKNEKSEVSDKDELTTVVSWLNDINVAGLLGASPMVGTDRKRSAN
jgi:endothelin-converting enzyme